MRQTVFGQPSYRIANDLVEVWVTERGGQMAPVTFRLGDRNVQPFHIAPWAHEPVPEPPMIGVLRGDFFCMPFGGNELPYEGRAFPQHGSTANDVWRPTDQWRDVLRMAGPNATKTVALREGTSAVYVSHRLRWEGPMSFGHHAMLRFQTEGLVATSPFRFGQVYSGTFEDPSQGGYSSLRPGARFDRLDAVPMANGATADLTRYPAREGFEDLVQVFSDPEVPFAWNAVTFPEEGYVWFALRDPRVLTGTILWHSNGGRHYAPWSGRHRRVLGIEDVTSYMHDGLAVSVAENDASRAGFRTFHDLTHEQGMTVKVIFGVTEVPEDFGHVSEIVPTGGGVEIRDGRQAITTALDLDHLTSE
ncbi:MAG: hypothetical protein ACO1SV_11935 [Fimbriimonas sp.]